MFSITQNIFCVPLKMFSTTENFFCVPLNCFWTTQNCFRVPQTCLSVTDMPSMGEFDPTIHDPPTAADYCPA